ncbi:MAG TPA: hypothetical protein VFM09_13550 [Marmoricola sp.]|nr:hypothetical protein [Marmoricola sp.]
MAEHRDLEDAGQEPGLEQGREQESREREAREREERIARRVERREQGRGRFKPGLSRGVPWQLGAPDAQAQEEALDHEISMIENAVREEGPLEEDNLRELVGARFWGPGRFRPAVKEALAEGRVVRVGHNRLAPPDATAQS